MFSAGYLHICLWLRKCFSVNLENNFGISSLTENQFYQSDAQVCYSRRRKKTKVQRGIVGVVVFIIKQPPLLMNFCFLRSHCFSLGANSVADIWNEASAQLQQNIWPWSTCSHAETSHTISWESFFKQKWQKCSSSVFFLYVCVMCKSATKIDYLWFVSWTKTALWKKKKKCEPEEGIS